MQHVKARPELWFLQHPTLPRLGLIMSEYNFPGYDDEPRTAENALQEWIDTQELDLSDDDTELLYQFTHYAASPELNIAAIQHGADYSGIDLTHSPLPTKIEA